MHHLTIDGVLYKRVAEPDLLTKPEGMDFADREAWKRGEWWYLTIYAEATVRVLVSEGRYASVTLRSPGCRGVECSLEDGDEYPRSVFEAEANELRETVKLLS